jgi:hypothetical protein
MNPRNRVLERRGLDQGQATAGQGRAFVFDNTAGQVNQPPKELDPVMKQKLEYYNSPHLVKTTTSVFPENYNLYQRAAMPCGMLVQPFLTVYLR